MEDSMTDQAESSRVTWETLEDWVRAKVQGLLQGILEEEVTEFLGRQRYARRGLDGDSAGYRNGYGKPRKLTLGCGTVQIRRPRVRGLEERFESRIVPMFCSRTKVVDKLIPELYLHGLAEGDFDLALRGLLGDDAPLSPSTAARLKEGWQGEYEAWKKRPLDDLEVVYLWVDGIYVRAGLEKSKAALLVAIAGLSDGRKEVVTVEPGYRESTESWSSILRDLKNRGMNCPRLVIGDGHLGLWGGLTNVYPDADEQRCWNHKILNVLDRIPKGQQTAARQILCEVPYAESCQDAEKRRRRFERWCGEKGFEQAADILHRDWERMMTFYNYPQGHWKHLRTTNMIESPFAVVRLRTNAAKRFKKVPNATAVIWKMLMIAEKRFKILDAAALLKHVFEGATYQNGQLIRQNEEKDAA